MRDSVEKAKIGDTDKQQAIKNLTMVAQQLEKNFIPNTNFDNVIQNERVNSYKYGGRTVFGKAKPPRKGKDPSQLSLFD